MNSDSECEFSASGDSDVVTSKTTKKRRKHGRMSDVMKKIRVSSYVTGEDCRCTRLKCFENVPLDERRRIIKVFNELGSYDKQNAYLCGLITAFPVQRRRNRKPHDEARINSSSYSYRVRIQIDGNFIDVPVCIKAFISIHGVTSRRIQTIRESLSAIGTVKPDGRGKHSNRPHKLTDAVKVCVKTFLDSLKGRKSHYSLKKSDKIYLSDELNISKLWTMYQESNPNCKISYDSFREIFNHDYNFSFGYPRKDTCSTCDSNKSKKAAFETSIASASEAEKIILQNDLDKLLVEEKLHLSKSAKFYELKSLYKRKSRKSPDLEAITMDYQKNLHCPNITTNDVYYKRQLNFVSFNIHVLSDQTSVFYTYDESVAKKGADDVCSMIDHFVSSILPENVRKLVIFCDSCAGQNKNYTVIRYLHYLVTQKNRFDRVNVVFPIRGHSYLECDRDMSLINQRSYVEVPEEWRCVIRNSRLKPSPFTVIDCKQDMFKAWTNFLKPMYKQTCPMPTRPIRCLRVDSSTPRLVYHRSTFCGCYFSHEITPNLNMRRGKKNRAGKGQNRQNRIINTPIEELKPLYTGPIPISSAKYQDLQSLTKFLVNPEAKNFYNNLKWDGQAVNQDDEYLDSINDNDD